MTESVSASPVAAPSFDDVLAFVRERAGDARLSSGELLEEESVTEASVPRLVPSVVLVQT